MNNIYWLLKGITLAARKFFFLVPGDFCGGSCGVETCQASNPGGNVCVERFPFGPMTGSIYVDNSPGTVEGRSVEKGL